MLLLLVEDNEDDILLTQEAIEEVSGSGFDIDLYIARNGLEALSYLEAGGKPHLILLDLNMPKMNGLMLLGILKDRNSVWKRIPVCILTTSNADIDIMASYDRHCACYLEKPVEFNNFVALILQIGHFWFHTVTLPFR